MDVIVGSAVKMLEMQEVGHPNRLEALLFLADCGRRLAESIQDQAWIEVGISKRQAALEEVAEGDPRRLDIVQNLGQDMVVRYHLSGLRSHIESAISYFEVALSMAVESKSSPALSLLLLGDALVTKFQNDGILADLDTGIEKLQATLDLVTDDAERVGDPLRALGQAWFLRYCASHSPKDLSRSKTIYERLFNEGEESDLARGQSLLRFGELLYRIFMHSWAEEKTLPVSQNVQYWDVAYRERALNRAIDMLQRSVDIMPPHHDSRRISIIRLGEAFAYRFDRSFAAADRQSSIKALEQGLTLTTEASQQKSGLHELLFRLYAHPPSTFDDVHLSIKHYESFIEATSYSTFIHGADLLRLGHGYLRRYQAGKVMRDLEQCILLTTRGLSLNNTSEETRYTLLSNLAIAYLERHIRIGAISDVDAAIRACNQGLELAPEPEIRTQLLLHLGLGYIQHYDYASNFAAMPDLDRGIKKLREALVLAPKSSQPRYFILSNIAIGRFKRCCATVNDSDISSAKEALREAIEEGNDRNVRLEPASLTFETASLGLESLSLTLDLVSWVASIRRKNGEGIQSLLMRAGSALVHTSTENRDSQELVFRAHLYATIKHMAFANAQDVDETLSAEMLQVLMDHSSSRLTDKLHFGSMLTDQYANKCSFQLACQTASLVVSLIPLLVPQSLENHDKQHLLKRAVGLASNAAALSIMCQRGDPYEAVRVLELGRGLIQTALNIVRADVTDLWGKHPTLAEAFLQLRSQLDSPIRVETPSVSDSGSLRTNFDPSQASSRYNTSRKFEQLLLEIRQQDGFDQFLLGPSEDDVKAASKGGPIVVVNVSKYKCDALIIRTDQIVSLWLPLLELEDISAYAKGLHTHVSTSILEWLWKVIVRPVLRVLGYEKSPSPGDPWPHICWIPTGLLSMFPIHAAGFHMAGDSSSLLDRAISTYSTSIWSVADRRRSDREKEPAMRPRVAAFVDSQDDLPYVEEEKNRVLDIWKRTEMQVLQPKPSLSDVLRTLNTCDIFHFAGHGKVNTHDPSQSALRLADGPLTVDSLQRINLRDQKPLLAYLSACGTGRNNDEKLIDENIHLIAACQLAGFQSVIGSLWQVDDESSAYIAADTYDWMRRHDMSLESVAEGLHHACRTLRHKWILATEGSMKKAGGARGERPVHAVASKHEDTTIAGHLPLHWVPFVLYGR
jgi:tetratricopeptide (TPR) repeat protein